MMLKRICALFTIAALLLTTAYAEGDVELFFKIGSFDAKLNGERISSYSYLSEQGNTMVEIRTVSETLGCTVTWYDDTREVGISDDGLSMRLKIDSDEAVINGSTVKMTEAAVIRNDKTFVPIRFISEGFGAIVGYDHETKTVTVVSMNYNGRIERLKDTEAELMTSYYNAVSSWLTVTDTEISTENFAYVWDCLVNSKIMELLPGRAIDENICAKYRLAAQMDFNSRFTVTKAANGTQVRIASNTREVSFVYDPATRTLTLNGVLPTFVPSISRSSGGRSRATAAPSPTETPSATGAPMETPSGTSVPTETPSGTSVPTEIPSETNEPAATDSPTDTVDETPRPTRRPGGSGGGAGGSTIIITPKPTENPTETATQEPTAAPTAAPTQEPEDQPGYASSTESPSEGANPSDDPINVPPETEAPTPAATAEPTAEPSEAPDMTDEPTPTSEPTAEPSPTTAAEPTDEPGSTPEPEREADTETEPAPAEPPKKTAAYSSPDIFARIMSRRTSFAGRNRKRIY